MLTRREFTLSLAGAAVLPVMSTGLSVVSCAWAEAPTRRRDAIAVATRDFGQWGRAIGEWLFAMTFSINEMAGRLAVGGWAPGEERGCRLVACFPARGLPQSGSKGLSQSLRLRTATPLAKARL
jgi:hypothetical protein